MKLAKFSVRNYRSIIESHVIECGDWTVLVGPNNEGKSNLLRAIATALDNAKVLRTRYLRTSGRTGVRQPGPQTGGYDWKVDFPLSLQASSPSGETMMRLWFDLSEDEKASFHELTGTRLRTALSIELRMGQTTRSFRVRLSGPAQQTLSGQREVIATFIEDRLDFDLISAIRTAEDASELIRRTVVRELSVIEDDAEYQTAIAAIDRLQEPILQRVATEIETTLREFLPDIRGVRIRQSSERRLYGVRPEYDIVVDDGNATPLAAKGDGVQSIAALSLRRAATQSRAAGKDLILLIEEPEAHLHPGAARKLRAVLQDVARTSQVVMTTHNPVFVDRATPSNNVIVEGSRARVATSMEDIRTQLGLVASDNLRNAELVLLVEGATDALVLRSVLAHLSGALDAALTAGRLAIEPAGGSDRIPFHASVLKMNLCHVHVLLDYDGAGRGAAAASQHRGILEASEVHFITARGRQEAELEDVLEVGTYAPAILNTFGVTLPSAEFNGTRAKWSGRMEAAFLATGKDWEHSKDSAKALVAATVSADPGNALNARRQPIDALVASLELHLATM